MKKYIDLRITGNETEIMEFLNLCCLISTFGNYGMSRNIHLNVDGDGSGRLNFYDISNGKRKWPSKEIEPLDYKDIQGIDDQLKGEYKASIGE